MSDQIKLGLALLLVIAGFVIYYFVDLSNFLRLFVLLLASAGAGAIVFQTASGQETWGFLLDARTEVRKVVWPTVDETIRYTLIVLAMVVVMALLMWFLDALLLWVMRLLTGPEG